MRPSQNQMGVPTLRVCNGDVKKGGPQMAQVNNAKKVKIWSRPAYFFWISYPLVLTVALLWGIFELWSDFDTAGKAVTFSELQLLELVALAGGLGSTVRLLRLIPGIYREEYLRPAIEHANSRDTAREKANSEDIDRKTFTAGIPFLFLRPFLGPPVAIIVYLAIRGGLLSGNTEQINHFGIGALAGVTGLFSDSAIDKLKQVFDVFLGIKPESRIELE